MEYENVDEATKYREACENVKKIAKAIKALKIKYYTNFAKISQKDQQIYQKLEVNLEKISKEHDLDRLKVALMEEISAKYDRKNINDNKKDQDNILQACYGAIDAQAGALSKGKITQAVKCQEILQQYLNEIDSASYRELITNYKREKFGELVKSKDAVQEKNNTWENKLKEFCKLEYAKDREDATKQVEEAKTNSIRLFDNKYYEDAEKVTAGTVEADLEVV